MMSLWHHHAISGPGCNDFFSIMVVCIKCLGFFQEKIVFSANFCQPIPLFIATQLYASERVAAWRYHFSLDTVVVWHHSRSKCSSTQLKQTSLSTRVRQCFYLHKIWSCCNSLNKVLWCISLKILVLFCSLTADIQIFHYLVFIVTIFVKR